MKDNVIKMDSLIQQRAKREQQTKEFNTVLYDINGMKFEFELVESFAQFVATINELKSSRLNMFRRQFEKGLIRAVKVTTPRGVMAMMIINPGVTVMMIGYKQNASIDDTFDDVLTLWRSSRNLSYPEFDNVG